MLPLEHRITNLRSCHEERRRTEIFGPCYIGALCRLVDYGADIGTL
jgi:hypothetical protein